MIAYIIAPSGNSKLEGSKIVSAWQVLPSVGHKNAFAGICTLSEYFLSSFLPVLIAFVGLGLVSVVQRQ